MGLFRRLGQKGQTGQSLVILAIGFLALLGFVGIVTDVSVLFIRYSTMRRAVDAAAIAAAGQMRRVEDTKLGQAIPIADGQATSIANLNLAARQFIEVYGLNPKSVLVETCRSQQVAIDAATQQPMDASGHFLFLSDKSPNPAADQATIKRYQQLCTSDELKLVRVTAQIDAPTIFLRLLGYPTVTLTESAISQTAVIDAVLIFDTAPSMANETTYQDWHTIPGSTAHLDVRYVPPYIDNPDVGDPTLTPTPRGNPWDFINDNNEATIDNMIDPSIANHVTVPSDPIQQQTIAFEPNAAGTGFQVWNQVGVSGVSALGVQQPREFCRVRAYPATYFNKGVPWLELKQDYFNFLGMGATGYSATHPNDTYAKRFFFYTPPTSPNDGAWFGGFVPMYNAPACCNDPLGDVNLANGDMSFSDLICQPFKDARDAAQGFLDRLDFLRGDRVGYVLFDRQAVPIDPDGTTGNPGGSAGSQASMMETQYDLHTNPADSTSPVLRKGAVETLQDVVGVQVDQTTYTDHNSDGLWDHLNDFSTERTYDTTYDDNGKNFMTGVHIGDIVQAPVSNGCPFDKAILDPQALSPASRVRPDNSVRQGGEDLLDDVVTIPSWYYTTSLPASATSRQAQAAGENTRFHSYEYQASCAHANIGGALGAGSAMLYNEGRREGAVWIMVMLSDGAAGASNPITRYGPGNPAPPVQQVQPYQTAGGHLNPVPGTGGPVVGGPVAHPSNAGYGAFGLCPYGTQANPSALLWNYDLIFPFCSDLDPATRHYCGTVAVNPDAALEQGFQTANNCFEYYDVDDYAHDYADWIGLADLPGSVSGGVTGRVSDQLLPTLFTIGFGINFDVGTATTCDNQKAISTSAYYSCQRGDPNFPGTTDSFGRRRARSADYMGEELLRYIADVGDNFQIDNDYWQHDASVPHTNPTANMGCHVPSNASDRIGNCISAASSWGLRGLCEVDVFTNGSWNPKPPGESCGNYYNAPTGQKLQQVFNDIASRMFTRLSQ